MIKDWNREDITTEFCFKDDNDLFISVNFWNDFLFVRLKDKKAFTFEDILEGYNTGKKYDFYRDEKDEDFLGVRIIT